MERIVWSSPAVATQRPPARTATLPIHPSCPRRTNPSSAIREDLSVGDDRCGQPPSYTRGPGLGCGPAGTPCEGLGVGGDGGRGRGGIRMISPEKTVRTVLADHWPEVSYETTFATSGL
jgi:hypothetical protein